MDHNNSWAAQPPAVERSSELYIRDYPHRSIAIVSPTHSLVLRYSTSANETPSNNSSYASLPRPRAGNSAGDNLVAKCMVEFSPNSNNLLKDYRPLTSRPIYGTLGLIAVKNEVFLSVITQASRAATVRPGETVERIGGVAFYCLSSADYDDVVPLDLLDGEGSDAASVYSQESAYGQGLGRRDTVIEHPCRDLRKLLSNGTFYYSTDFDVTNRVQSRYVLHPVLDDMSLPGIPYTNAMRRPLNSNSFDIDQFDETYLWNSFMISPLVKFRSRLMPPEMEALDASRILTSAIRGFCKTMTIPQSGSPLRSRSGMPSFLTLISRLSCLRAGTRFNARGIDDDGHVANFVETETTFWTPSGILFSYAQVRGSIPIFWEQVADLIPGRQKVTVTRSPDGAQPAFNKHFEELEQEYGAIHVINLLSETKPSEVELGDLYKNAIRHSPLSRPGPDGSSDHALLQDTHYDFHAETKGPAGYEAAKGIRRYIEDAIDVFLYYVAEETSEGGEEIRGVGGRMVTVFQQKGVFRTNCLDCLDRTNLIQTLVSQMAVDAFLGHRGEHAASDFWMRHSTLWADNGDNLSKIYAGTGALKSSYTRTGKMSLAGAVADMRKSVQRIYHNNFLDPSRQITIDMLLGRLVGQGAVHLFDPISDYVSGELSKRSNEFTSFRGISMWVGTFNLNGRTTGVDQDLSPWLFPAAMGSAQPDIYVVGLQEIVELSPQQIMNSDPSRKQLWEQAIKRTLNQRQASRGGEKYVLLRSGQLVGAALCIFVKTSSLEHIKNVEGSVKKTGLSGMAGNKGAVAIRFDYANTPICFVTAHLAAGFANYEERNRDYTTINHGLRFQRGRSIDNHEAVIWLGDFNYRIGLSSEAARGLIKKRDLETLYENDQLNLQMVAGLAFDFYSEARITFMPTYKFDLGKDEYDTSEKARIPAWTDRILRKGQYLRQFAYDSAPLRFSDHRPVYAAFECRVSIVDEGQRESISQQLYERRKAEVGDLTAHAGNDDTDDEDLIGYEAVEPGLPPASSDRQKWWLDNKQPARAHINVPNGPDGRPMALNPNRPSNPFPNTEESDWISVPRSSSRATSFSSLSSSPYEKVNIPRGMNVGQGPGGRKMLSSYDTLPAQVGRMRMDDEQSIRSQGSYGDDAGPPPPPPPRRPTGGSGVQTPVKPLQEPLQPYLASSPTPSQSSLAGSKSGKPPPPVGKKPAHLTSPGTSPATLTGSINRKPVLASSNSPASNSPTAQRSLMSTGVGLPGMTNGPGLPARKPIGSQMQPAQQQQQQQQQGQRRDMDLLDSLDSGPEPSFGAWETLQPSKN